MFVRVNLSMIVHWEFYRLSRKPYVGLKILSYAQYSMDSTY